MAWLTCVCVYMGTVSSFTFSYFYSQVTTNRLNCGPPCGCLVRQQFTLDEAHHGPWGWNPGLPCASPALNQYSIEKRMWTLFWFQLQKESILLCLNLNVWAADSIAASLFTFIDAFVRTLPHSDALLFWWASQCQPAFNVAILFLLIIRNLIFGAQN